MAKNKTGMKWLRHRMDELGYKSLEQVASKANINRGNLYRYFAFETRPSIDVVPELARALNVQREDILNALEVEQIKTTHKFTLIRGGK